MSSFRGVACALIAAFMVSGCRSQSRALEVAVTSAGAQIRRQIVGETWQDLSRDLEAFLEKDVVFVREKAKAQKEKDRSTYRFVGIGGLALILGGAGTDTISTGARVGLITLGTIAAGGGFVLLERRTAEMEACAVFLARAEGDMKDWGQENLKSSDEVVPPQIWQEYVRRTTEIVAYPKCLRVRTP
jgi:hypothetical protein